MSASITSVVTTGQKDQAARLIGDVSKAAASIAIDQMVEDGEISFDSIQRFLGKGNRLKTRLIPLLKTAINELSALVTSCLKLISSGKELMLDPTDGTETIADANDVFNYIDADFRGYGCDVTAKPTSETNVQVYEMAADADFRTMFCSFEAELDDLCLTQPQIKQFVKRYRGWLRAEGYATLFLFKANDEFFVAYVYLFSDGELRAYVRRFSFGRVWGADDRYRVVVPQLTAS